MKWNIFFSIVMIFYSSFNLSSQVLVSQIEGRLELYPTNDTTSVYLGKDAGLSHNQSTINRNTFVGFASGRSNSIGSQNTFIGTNAGTQNFTAAGNTFIGHAAGFTTTVGSDNCYIGKLAGNLNATGEKNVFIGAHSGSRIHGTKNVLIGFEAGPVHLGSTSPPLALNNKLYVHNSSNVNPLIYGEFDTPLLRVNGQFQTRVGNSQNTFIGLFEETENILYGYEFEYDGTEDKLHLWSRNFANNEDRRMTWLKDGKVGIGTTSPTHTLDVDGMARIRILPNVTTNVIPVYAQISAGQLGTLVTNASDERLKENIVPIEDALDVINKMRAYYYNYRSDNNKTIDVGLLAQEVEQIVPTASFTNPSTGHMGIIYEKLVPFLIEGIKQQQKKLLRQEKLMNTMIREHEKLSQRIAILEHKFVNR